MQFKPRIPLIWFHFQNPSKEMENSKKNVLLIYQNYKCQEKCPLSITLV